LFQQLTHTHTHQNSITKKMHTKTKWNNHHK
jgi:hypothetical protein